MATATQTAESANTTNTPTRTVRAVVADKQVSWGGNGYRDATYVVLPDGRAVWAWSHDDYEVVENTLHDRRGSKTLDLHLPVGSVLVTIRKRYFHGSFGGIEHLAYYVDADTPATDEGYVEETDLPECQAKGRRRNKQWYTEIIKPDGERIEVWDVES